MSTHAQRLAAFTRSEFNPRSDQSWDALDTLWRAACAERHGDSQIAAKYRLLIQFIRLRLGGTNE